MEDLSSDDPASQSMPLGSVFIAIAIVVWTSVAIWLCYSGPPGNDPSVDIDSDSQPGDGTNDLSDCVTGKVGHGFTELLLEGKEDKSSPVSQCDARSLDLFKLEELLTPSKGDCKGLLNKVTGSSVAKGLLNKVAGSGGKDGNGHLTTGLSGLSLGSDKDGTTGCDPRSTPSPARAPGDLEGRASRAAAVMAAGLDDEVGGEKPDFAGLREQLRDKLSASLNNGARKPTDPLDLASVAQPLRSGVDMNQVDALDPRGDRGSRGPSGVASAKREALEDFLKQLLHPPGPGLRGEDKSSVSRARGKLTEGSENDEKEVSTRPATMLSMAEHAREVGNKYLQDRHFAAATHCYEVACLLYPAGMGAATGASAAVSATAPSGHGVSAAPGSGTSSGGSSGSPGQLAAYHCNCALACLELGRYGDAINEGNAALVLTPPKHLAVKALYRLAVAHANLKNAFEARRCLKKCLDFDPKNEYVRAFLARLGDEEVISGGLERQLTWIDPPKRVQCLGAVAREKAKGKKAKQKSGGVAVDEPMGSGSASNGGPGGGLQSSLGSGGKDASSSSGGNASAAARSSEVRLDREAGLWHSMARHNNKLYILGGWSVGVVAPGAFGSGSSSLNLGKGDVSNNGHGSSSEMAHGSDELHVFDVDTFELRQLSGPNSKPPHPCYCHTATMVGGNMIVFGGCGPPSDQPALVMVFDVQQAKWRVPQTAGVPPRQRQGHSASVVQGDRHLCIFGGIEPTEQHRVAIVYNDAHLLDLQSYAWRKLEVGGHRPPARFGHTATNLPGSPGKLLIVGGRDHLGSHAGPAVSGGFTGLHILDTERRLWVQQPFSGTPPLQAFYHSACVLDDSTILFLTSGVAGNEGLNGTATLPLYLLDLEAWHWSSPRASGCGPAPHIGHTAALVGSRVYMFGGVVIRGGQPAADKAVYVLDASPTRPALTARAPERDVPQVLEKPSQAHASQSHGQTHGTSKAERSKTEKAKGEASKAATLASSSPVVHSIAPNEKAQVATASPTTSPAIAVGTSTPSTRAATPTATQASSSATTSATPSKVTGASAASGAGASNAPQETKKTGASAALQEARKLAASSASEAGPGAARKLGSSSTSEAVAADDHRDRPEGGHAQGHNHRAEKNSTPVAPNPKPSVVDSSGRDKKDVPPPSANASPPSDPHPAPASTSSSASNNRGHAVPARAAVRAAVATGGDKHQSQHAAPATVAATCQPTGGRASGHSGAGGAAAPSSGRPNHDSIAMMLGESEFDGDLDDATELSFEELLEQEKAFFKAQSEKPSFPRAKESGGGGGGKKGHRF